MTAMKVHTKEKTGRKFLAVLIAFSLVLGLCTVNSELINLNSYAFADDDYDYGFDFGALYHVESLWGDGRLFQLGAPGLNNGGDIFEIPVVNVETGQKYQSFCAYAGAKSFANHNGCSGYQKAEISLNNHDDVFAALNYINNRYGSIDKWNGPHGMGSVVASTRLLTQVTLWNLATDVPLNVMIDNTLVSYPEIRNAILDVFENYHGTTGVIDRLAFLICADDPQHREYCQPQLVPLYRDRADESANNKGNVTIRKFLGEETCCWGITDKTLFTAYVRDEVSGEYLIFSGTGPNYTFKGTGVNPSSPVMLRAEEEINLFGIPAGMRIKVEEDRFPTDANIQKYIYSYDSADVHENAPAFSPPADWPLTPDSDYGVDDSAWILVDQTLFVGVRNSYTHGTEEEDGHDGNLVIIKELGENYAEWGKNGVTEFTARVMIVGGADDGRFLSLTGTAPLYEYDGASGSGTAVTFSEGMKAIITGIPGGTVVQVIEETEYFWTASYSNYYTNDELDMLNDNPNNGIVTIPYGFDGDSAVVRVTNDFITLEPEPEPEPPPPPPVTTTTTPPPPVTTTTPPPPPVTTTTPPPPPVTTTTPPVTTTTTPPPVVTTTTTPPPPSPPSPPVTTTPPQQPPVTATPTPPPSAAAPEPLNNEVATGNLIINKMLAGAFEDWDRDNSVMFEATVRDINTGEFLVFSGSHPNYFYMGSNSTGTIVEFNVSRPAVIKLIPAGMEVVVEEILRDDCYYIAYYDEHEQGFYELKDTVCDPIEIIESRNSVVTIYNFYYSANQGINLVINKSLVDFLGNETGTGSYFAARLYDSSFNLVERIDLVANRGSVVIENLKSSTTYYLIEEEHPGYSILGFEIRGIAEINSTAVGLQIPVYSYDTEIHVVIRNVTDGLFELPDIPIPRGAYQFPDDPPPIIEIPEGLPPRGAMQFPDDDPAPPGDTNPRTRTLLPFAVTAVSCSAAILFRKRHRR
jgi:hypothetical protein